jgi:carbamoyl-phosphate synthase large subunit
MKALRLSDLSIRIITSDLNPHSVGLFFSEGAYLLPRISDSSYLKLLTDLCQNEKVDMAFIGAEPEIRFLAPHVKALEKETKTVFAISRPQIISACMDKLEMARLLAKHGFQCPESVAADDETGVQALLNKFGFPLFIKPRHGSGSKEIFIVHNEIELNFFRQYVKNAVVQEFLPQNNEEYTVGVYVNQNGKAIGSIVCKRELASGLTYRAYFDAYPEIADYCEMVASSLRILGPCNFQLRMSENGPSIFEINPRCSSTTVMRAVMGFNEPELAIRDLVFHQSILRPQVKCGMAFRYWEEAYINHTLNTFNVKGYGKIELPKATIYPRLMTKHRLTKEQSIEIP